MNAVFSRGYRHSRESGGPGLLLRPCPPGIPAFAGMTESSRNYSKLPYSFFWFGSEDWCHAETDSSRHHDDRRDDGYHRSNLSTRYHRARAASVSSSGQRQPDREG